MNSKLVYLVFLVFLLAIPIASAGQQSLGIFKQDSSVILKQSCANCTFNNVTSVLYPNSTIAMGVTPMSQSGSEYSIAFNKTSVPGNYIVNGIGNPDGSLTVWTYDFDINPLGAKITGSKASFYISLLIILILIFLALIIYGLSLPYKNSRDELSGYILDVNNLKYLKILSLCLAYLIAVVITYLAYIISYSFLEMDFLGNLLYFIFYAMIILIIPLFIVGTYLFIANWVRDSKIADGLQRGFRIR